MNLTSYFRRTLTLHRLALFAGLVTATLLIHGCGEKSLPPAGPPAQGAVKITGEAM
jgi:hypothetical protein